MKVFSKKGLIIGASIEIIVVCIRGVGGFRYAGLSAIIIYTLVFFLLRKYQKTENEFKSIFFSFLIMFSLFNVIPRITYFKSSLSSLPESLVHLLTIIACGLFFTKSINITLRYMTGSVILVFCFFITSNFGYNLWLHRLNYGTFTGSVKPYSLADFELQFSNGTLKNSHSAFENKYTLLYFWNTGCGICFKSFPELERIYQSYKSDSAISLYAANFQLKSDTTNEAFNAISKREYSFPVFIMNDSIALEEMKVSVYPTTLVLNQNSEIEFRGDLEKANLFLRNKFKY